MNKLLAIVLLLTTPSWGQFGMNTPLRTNTGGLGCPAAATGPQPASLRGSTINTAVAICVTTPFASSSVAGDLAVLFFVSGDANGLNVPFGWTQIYQTPAISTDWNVLAAYKILSSGDIAAGSVQECSPNGVPFDVHLAIAVFAGGTGSIREYQAGFASSGPTPIVNTTSSAVLSTDVGLYFASERTTNPLPLPIITPATGSAAILRSAKSIDACSLMDAQQMPGGALVVANSFSAFIGNGTVAIQVIVENP